MIPGIFGYQCTSKVQLEPAGNSRTISPVPVFQQKVRPSLAHVSR
uniref:Uncharacterized protein n=1 Tax=Rhizophora mucronata TaxID=61149 RepID=A0A2P2MNM6_RHIMU